MLVGEMSAAVALWGSDVSVAVLLLSLVDSLGLVVVLVTPVNEYGLLLVVAAATLAVWQYPLYRSRTADSSFGVLLWDH